MKYYSWKLLKSQNPSNYCVTVETGSSKHQWSAKNYIRVVLASMVPWSWSLFNKNFGKFI